MTKTKYILNISHITRTEVFEEATENELRVLIALIERSGDIDAGEISALTKLSETRVKSALTLWEGAGIISRDSHSVLGHVEYEFEDNPLSEKLDEEESVEVAKSIRSGELADVISECARLMNRPNLNTQEVKRITALWSQLALSGEYILTLAAHMAEGGRLTAQKLSQEATKLTDMGITTVEELNSYIKNAEESTSAISEVRRIVGIWNRNLSTSEKTYFTKWVLDYEFSTVIIEEAFNAAAAAGTPKVVSYMHKILTEWHKAGCKTLEDCRRHSAEQLAKIQAKKAESAKRRGKSSENDDSKEKKPVIPKYSTFDAEEALQRALARSYGSSDTGEGDN